MLQGAKSGLYGGWENNCHLKELISSTVDAGSMTGGGGDYCINSSVARY